MKIYKYELPTQSRYKQAEMPKDAIILGCGGLDLKNRPCI